MNRSFYSRFVLLISKNRTLTAILLTGFILRALFTLFIATHYFGRDNIYVDGDTMAWFTAFKNLLEHGTYTCNPYNEYGYFGRMPGYSFFIGFFYLLTFKNIDTAFILIAWVQILADVVSVLFIYKIAERIWNSNKVSLIAAFLYATYPFAIVWTPVVYSETMSVFLMLAACYAYLSISNEPKRYIISGLLIVVAALFRPQVLVLAIILGVGVIWQHKTNYRRAIVFSFIYGTTLLMSYGVWPARNYLIHGKAIIAQDLRGFENWNEDMIAFMQYIYSVKTEWEPQFSQILHNKQVEMPKEAYLMPDDSVKLAAVFKKCSTCSQSFSHWKGYWQQRVPYDDSCTREIKQQFDQLRYEQMHHNTWHYWIVLPLLNIKKSVLKSKLYYSGSFVRKAAGALFYYRSFLIMLGLIATWFAYRHTNKSVGKLFIFIVFAYFVLWYICLSAGTGPQYRNIEMRYLLQTDILLLLPAAYFISRCFKLNT